MSDGALAKIGSAVVALGILATLGGFIFFEKIDNGYVGVRYSMNGGIKDDTLGQGVKFVGLDKVIQYPIRLQTIKAKDVAVSTSDGKKVTIDIKYDYKVDPTKASKMYKEFGNITSEDIEKGWLKSKLQKEAREVYSDYDVLSLLSGESSKAEAKLIEQFAEAVESKGFLVEDVTVSVPEVDKEMQAKIDGIINSGQENEKAKLDAETEKTKAETEATKVRLKAEAEAQAIRATAEAQAEANKKIAQSVTDELIKYEEAQARKEKGWVTTIVGGDSTTAVVADDKDDKK